MNRFVSKSMALTILLVATLAIPGAAQDLKSFEEKTTVHKLANGWTFIITERPVAPVFSFATMVNVGSAQEVPGITGLAHMFEHMAFKGTQNIGTRDFAAEKKALDALEAAYQAYQAARLVPDADPQKVEALLAAFQAKQKEAAGYVVKGEFDDVLTREGGVGLNAFTGADSTGYFYSLPSNKVELFAFLESERFFHPVFREFYEERDVVQEERRLRSESSPVGRLIEQFVAVAFSAHPYQQPVVGYMSDLQSITITDAEAFFRTHYAPSNLVTAVVGDVRARELIPMLEKYFGRIPARPGPPPLRTVEPPQGAERIVILEDPSQPVYLEAYHKPARTHADQAVYDAINDILSRGRTSRLYRSLVRDKKLAVSIQSFSGFPGDKYPNLWAVLAYPALGVTNEAVQAALREEIERLKREDVTDEELARFKTRAKASLLRRLGSNQGLALQMAEHQQLFGDWRELFRSIERLDKVTKEDIRRVAGAAFQANNRTVAMIVNNKPAGQQPAATPAAPGGGR
ncbi:MAG TPA: pitrilysin family protein [Thermoanaerobaculia bacterium]|nr:pitrilysin family protein [Thermoanaerobaculia bacterium]